MKEFILDVNVEVDLSKPNCPAHLFKDLRSPNKVKLVIGGGKYRKEVARNKKLLGLISELIAAGKVRAVDTSSVDEHEKLLTERVDQMCIGGCPNECDDFHIFALAQVGACFNVVTNDTRMATCRDKIRGVVGHDYCPPLRIVSSRAAYDATPTA